MRTVTLIGQLYSEKRFRSSVKSTDNATDNEQKTRKSVRWYWEKRIWRNRTNTDAEGPSTTATAARKETRVGENKRQIHSRISRRELGMSQ